MKINSASKAIILSSLLLILTSFQTADTLKGTWEYAGDIFNDKKEPAPTAYILQRKYTEAHFEAYVIEKGYVPEMYETGDYTLNADSCIEIQTFSTQDSKLLNIPVHYHYKISNDTLILKGILPNGERVEEYWKKVK
ncbi:hypothetical protein SAMN05216490_2161 [Mucilaginibacter mallensis]|uniref:Lipocalin-like domain-containing protein n=1 Tax=Mucilaginibacter mallensis TaxID=652787 RepID=A0A1H1WDR3_MUCMA|nr:hypothetical protein [Mucilaginibacter mallensis]SDS95155.1 hypothetical protein SAMN05216490_2161 [Mucilaginibacter mallensis]